MTNFQKLILGMATLALFLSVFSILVLSRSTLFPFIVGKYVFFRSMVSLTAILLLILLLTGWRPKPHQLNFFKSHIFWAVSAFVFIFFLAGVFGVDFQNSFWSNFERGEGVFAMFHYYLFMVLAFFLLEREKDWERFFQASIIAGLLMSVYGLAQLFDIPGVININVRSAGEGGLARIQGTLGNPAYVSVYLLFVSFYALYLLSKEKNIWKKIFYISSLAVFAFAFISTQTRGTFLGLAVGVFFAFAFLLWKLPERRPKIIIAAVMVFLILAGGTLVYFRDADFLQGLPGARLLTISIFERNAQTRFWTWGSAWQGFLERPLLGWGPENFSWVFDKYFDTRHFIGINVPTETWFDRAHSIYFDYLTETGILGLAAFLSIFILIFRQVFKIEFKNVYQQTAALVLPIAYLGQGLILFDVLPVYINLFLFWGFMSYLSSYAKDSS